MNTMNKKSGFTLLEIIIVVIIIGVLASLALPRFFRMVEYSRTAEALTAITAIRGAVERCEYRLGLGACNNWQNIALENPTDAPNSHWTYEIAVNSPSSGAYEITATRNDNEDTSSAASNDITVTVDPDAGTMTRTGTGPYVGI